MSTRKELHAAAREELVAGFDARMRLAIPAGFHGHTDVQRLKALGETVVDMVAKRDARIVAVLGGLES